MAQGDSYSENLDKRTRSIENNKVKSGEGMADREEASTQLQAIQAEQRNNLSLRQADIQATSRQQDVMSQAAQIATESAGPSTAAVLGKYGIPAPKVLKKETHDVKVVPPKIEITNNNYNTTNNSGPVGGRDIAFKSPDTEAAASQGKFKNWLNTTFLAQKEENNKREREYEKRESSLVRSSNKMLSKITAAGREMAESFNPSNFGQSVGNQFRILLLIFVTRFLAKHWTKVLRIISWVGDKIKAGLDYFGITTEGKKMMARGGGIRGDIISFFGGDPKRDNLFTLFKKIGEELIDHLKRKLDHAMELRGEAIKAIQFPSLSGDINTVIGNIAGYLGNILTALVDPKAGIQASIRANISNAGLTSSTRAMQESESRGEPGYFDEQKGFKDTSAGDAAIVNTVNGKRRYSLLPNSLSGNELANNTSASMSQSMDILGALNDAKSTGRIDTARVASGLQRMSNMAEKEGLVTVDGEFVRRMFASAATPLIKAGHIKTRRMRLIQVPKTTEELQDMENAGGFIAGAGQTFGAESMTEMIPSGSARYAVNLGIASRGSRTIGAAQSGSRSGGLFHTAATALTGGGNNAYYDAAVSGVQSWMNKFAADKYVMKMVPDDDPRVKKYRNIPIEAYTLDKTALNAMVSRLFHTKEINSSDENFVKSIRNVLYQTAGGKGAAQAKFSKYGGDGNMEDFDVDQQFQSLNDFTNHSNQYDAIDNNDDAMKRMRAIGNNAAGLGSSAWDAAGNAIENLGVELNKIKITKGAQKKNGGYVMGKLMKGLGLTKAQAAGVTGNLMFESSLNPSNNIIDTNNRRAGGLAMWNGENFAKLINYAKGRGKDWRDLDVQTDFLVGTLDGSIPYGNKQINEVNSRLRRASTPQQAATAFFYYEKFKGYNNWGDHDGFKIPRIQYANSFAGVPVNNVYVPASLSGDSSNISTPSGGFNTSSSSSSGSSASSVGGGSDDGTGLSNGSSSGGGLGNTLVNLGNKIENANPFDVKTPQQMAYDTAMSNLKSESGKEYDSPILRKMHGKNYTDFEKSWIKTAQKDRARQMKMAAHYKWAMGVWNAFPTPWQRLKFLKDSNADDFATRVATLSDKDFKSTVDYVKQAMRNSNELGNIDKNFKNMEKENPDYKIFNEGLLWTPIKYHRSDKESENLNKEVVKLIQMGEIDAAKKLIADTYDKEFGKGNSKKKTTAVTKATGKVNKIVNKTAHQDTIREIDSEIKKNDEAIKEAYADISSLSGKERDDKWNKLVKPLLDKKEDLNIRKKAIETSNISSKTGGAGTANGDKKSAATVDKVNRIDKLIGDNASIQNQLKKLGFEHKLYNFNDDKDSAKYKEDKAKYDALKAKLNENTNELDKLVIGTGKSIKLKRKQIEDIGKALGVNMKQIEGEYKAMVEGGLNGNKALLELQKKYGATVIEYLRALRKDMENEVNSEIKAIQNEKANWGKSHNLSASGSNAKYVARWDRSTPESFFSGKTAEERHINKILFLYKNHMLTGEELKNYRVLLRKYGYGFGTYNYGYTLKNWSMGGASSLTSWNANVWSGRNKSNVDKVVKERNKGDKNWRSRHIYRDIEGSNNLLLGIQRSIDEGNKVRATAANVAAANAAHTSSIDRKTSPRRPQATPVKKKYVVAATPWKKK